MGNSLINPRHPAPQRRNIRGGKSLQAFRARAHLAGMQCTFAQEDNVLVACPSGRLDTNTYNDFKTALHAELDKAKPRHLVIDLTDLEYVSSAGFREFFLAGRRMSRDGGTLSVCSFQPAVKELFDIAQFMTAYAVHDTREAAIAAAKAA